MRFIISLILSATFLSAFPQTATISGRVLDSKTLAPLPFANAFINNTTIGSATDENGNYKIINVPVGQNEIVFSFVGYHSYQTKVDLTDQQSLTVNVRLVPNDKMLEDVQVQGKRDKVWDRQIKRFNRAFLGSGKAASHCTITNPWVLEFTEEKETLLAKASDNLIIQNDELGYTISYSLKKFMVKGGEYSILGNSKFEEMTSPDVATESKWNRNRFTAYAGSLRHLIRAIIDHRLYGEGFLLYSDKVGFENSPRSSVFARELGNTIEPFDTTRIQILYDPATHGSKIHIKNRIEVHYTKSASSIASYDDIIVPVSWIDLKNSAVRINSSGVVIDPENMVTSGYMSSLRIADMLPNNYKPTPGETAAKRMVQSSPDSVTRNAEILKASLSRLFEKVYIQTDKPYYYPGERIWFKACINYYYPSARSELSNTLYVELINSRTVILEKMIRLDSGFAHSDFILPDTIKEGNYYLRAYTLLQRNFGDEYLFTKSLPVLKSTNKPVYSNEKEYPQSTGIKVTPNKSSYTTREKIALTVELSEDSTSTANLCVAVTDMAQVLNIPNASIAEKFPIKKDDIHIVHNLKYLAEDGFSLKGRFLNDKGKGEQIQLGVIQLNPYRLGFVVTDNQGYFQYWNLQFYGQDSLSIAAPKRKGKSYGKVKLFKYNTPPISVKNPEYAIQTIDAQTVQRIFSEYEKPVDSRMLEEVEIISKMEDDLFIKNTSKINRPYGEAEYVFDESRIKTQFPNLLYTLQALNISGLVVNPNTETIYFARQAKPVLMQGGDVQEIAKSYSPMVTLDGMPLMGSAGEALATIDPNTVGSIEVSKKPSSIRGSLAPFGVISVYTKSGYLKTKPERVDLNLLKVEGYSAPNRFIAPDYSDPGTDKTIIDYRSTLYWNPKIKITNSAPVQLSFYASDLKGTYRIVMEGVDGAGNPLRSVNFIEIK